MKVYGSPGSPYVRKVRAYAAEKGVALEYVIDRPSVPGSRIAEFNPLGKIPVLMLDDGEAVYDSVVIVDYLEGLAPSPRLVPADLHGRMAVRRWEALGDGIAEAAIMISHDWGPMNDPDKRGGWVPKQQGKIERALAHLEAAITGREWLHGDAFSLADVGVVYALCYLDQVLSAFEWRSRHPALAAYAGRVASRPSFRSTDPAAT
jgi:glutathione S-transferase